jgi:hypothetical protein
MANLRIKEEVRMHRKRSEQKIKEVQQRALNITKDYEKSVLNEIER